MPASGGRHSPNSSSYSPHEPITGISYFLAPAQDLRRVWTPGKTQEESSGVMQRVVRADACAASTAAVHTPRARMGVRRSGPIRNHALKALVAKLVFLIPSQ
jgi:hypothetical protein